MPGVQSQRTRGPPAAYPQIGVELVQDQAHGAGQVADVGRLLVQSVLEHLKVLHPLDGEAVVDDVGLQGRGRAEHRRAVDGPRHPLPTPAHHCANMVGCIMALVQC